MIININLQQLACLAETRSGGSKPYLWSVLLAIDDETISTGAGAAIASFVSPPDGERTLISNSMRAGDTAPVPSEVAHFGCRFLDSSARKDLILITLLLDEHDTPITAVAAGYSVFLHETRSAVADNLLQLASSDPATVKAATAAITARIKTAVTAAVKNELSWLDEVEIGIHVSTPDAQIDNSFVHLNFAAQPPPHGPLVLEYGAGTGTHFQLTAALAMTDDPCESQQVALSGVQADIANIRGAMLQLARSTTEGPKHDQQATKLKQELAAAQVQLENAQGALGRCRLLHRVTTIGTTTVEHRSALGTTEHQAERSLKTP